MSMEYGVMSNEYEVCVEDGSMEDGRGRIACRFTLPHRRGGLRMCLRC
jgi:hypothetical protein